MLELQLLGTPQIRLTGTPLTSLSAKSQALLFYLAMTRRPHSRLAVAGLLWPEKEDQAALANLRQALLALRKVLPDYLLASRHTLALDGQMPLAVDALRFEVEANRGLTGNAADLIGAAHAYTGDFLAGFYVDEAAPFEEWLLLARERLHELALRVFQQLADEAVAARDPERALHYMRRLLAHEPWREDSHRLAMGLLASLGRRADALAQYEQCREALATDLGVEPGAETTALYEQIRTRTFAATLSATAGRPLDPPKLSAHPLPSHNLPSPLTSFVGRDGDVAAIRQMLHPDPSQDEATDPSVWRRPPVRLLTLTGPGGVGKSRLALQVAHRLQRDFADGIWYVELGQLTDGALVAQTVATVLGVSEEFHRPLAETLAEFLRHRQLLLLLDGCEHLIRACAQLAERLLAQAPRLRILTTSLELLRIDGEVTYPVAPLSAPGSAPPASHTDFLNYDAVRLFVDRASAAHPTFAITKANAPALAQICLKLDGLPLAIELAAACVRMLPPAQIAEQLAKTPTDGFRLLTQGSRTAAARHRSLQALIEWSYSLLSRGEQILLRRLAVFAGGWTLAGAEAVCAVEVAGAALAPANLFDLLMGLVDKSLVVVVESEGQASRYRLLETIRRYAALRLDEAGERSALMARFVAYLTTLTGSVEAALKDADPARWFAGLEAEQDNVRSALHWSRQQDEIAAELRLVGALCTFWIGRGYHREGLAHVSRILAQPDRASQDPSETGNLQDAGFLNWWASGNLPAARTLLTEALRIESQEGNIAHWATLLNNLSGLATRLGEYAVARSLLAQSLAISPLKDGIDTAWSWTLLGDLALAQDEIEAAQEAYTQAVAVARPLDAGPLLAYGLRRVGQMMLRRQPAADVTTFFEESLELNRQAGDQTAVAACLVALAVLAFQRGQPEDAARLLSHVEATLAAGSHTLLAYDQAEFERLAAQLRGLLPPDSYAAAWSQGRSLTREQALALGGTAQRQ